LQNKKDARLKRKAEEAELDENGGAANVMSGAVTVDYLAVPTPEKVNYLKGTYQFIGGANGSFDDRTYVNVTYVACKVFEAMHMTINKRTKPTLAKSYSKYLESQVSMMCNGASQASIQKTLFDKMRKTVWAPCRLSALQDSLAGCSLKLCTSKNHGTLQRCTWIQATNEEI
jgi:hypothetical protein